MADPLDDDAGGRIAIGVIRKPHGVHGEASVELWTDSAERFDGLSDVVLVSPDESEVRPTAIESVRAHGGRALVRLAGVDSPEAVSALRNWTIEIDEREARSLEEGEYFIHDLPGMSLHDSEGNERGVVANAIEGGGGILLEVERKDGSRFDVPFAAAICTKVDLAARTILVDFPAGLDDLDSVDSDRPSARPPTRKR
jgi:16S rRNA processing protein RimM